MTSYYFRQFPVCPKSKILRKMTYLHNWNKVLMPEQLAIVTFVSSTALGSSRSQNAILFNFIDPLLTIHINEE